ncbi:hypothetical protein IF188_08275 [Microbacterium sp. NEAU-LLC]|uniref:AP2/ERF domain-containing protein n=1 Tax=Microbacterium helvum TaxID=2773713 RepID=A0ABR8NLZ5_9MICO|nr:AP2 domain-containing protein [Microbacterium helvum]MBD3941688.1 hypothetical protein [Microbacterium helvum]
MTTTKRPYRNVRRSHGGDRWEAIAPRNGTSHYIGTFDTPEEAKRASLIAQAEHLEAKAAAYRIEAEEIAR